MMATRWSGRADPHRCGASRGAPRLHPYQCADKYLRPSTPGLRGQKLAVDGWIYSISDGLITDLNVTVSRPEELFSLARHHSSAHLHRPWRPRSMKMGTIA